MNTNTINAAAATMYTKAKKILGYWVVFLESEKNNPKAVVQFKSLSRKTANDWATLNAAVGVSVWRNREAMPA